MTPCHLPSCLYIEPSSVCSEAHSPYPHSVCLSLTHNTSVTLNVVCSLGKQDAKGE